MQMFCTGLTGRAEPPADPALPPFRCRVESAGPAGQEAYTLYK